MSARRFVPLAVLVVLTFAAAVAWPRATIAQAPPEVPQLSGPVTDLADSGDAAVPGDGSLSDLEDERGYQLFSLFVDSTQPTPIAQYTEDVARQNGLGAADALLVVAIEDRTYQLWLGDTIAESVTEGEQDGILARSVEPQLRDGDYTGAVSAAANGINSASGSGGGGSAWGWLIPVALIIGLALLAFWFIRRMWTRSRAEPAGGTGQARRRKKPVRELETEANTLLLQLDEGVREAEQELAFSEAAGDGTELAEFQAAIKTAKQHLRRAFELRQALDDQKTGPEEQQRSTLEAVITECEAGRQLLVEQFTRVNERRDYERDAPATLERLSSEVAALEARLPEAERTMTSLRTQAETAWRPVRGNIDEATKRAA
ncbi:MAG: TPM domain-containing protein, partial [Dehalococcoidia bacterium]|nr:TPM domain-containing protein [Dehalococcoidia bacterium]